MPFEFDSSTPLSIKNMNIRRPLRPLSTNNQRRPESYLKPASKPLRSILKNRNVTRSPVEIPPPVSGSKVDFLSSLKGMGSKIFTLQENKPVQEEPVKKLKTTTDDIKNESVLKMQELTTKVQYLEKQVQMLEEQNFALLRANKTNLLHKEMEKQDLEIQNQLLKREIASLNKKRDLGNDSDLIHSFKSKVDNYDNKSISNLSKVKNLYKMDDDEDNSIKYDDEDGEMTSIRKKIQQRKQRKILADDDLGQKIAMMERNILILSSRLVDNELPQSSDLALLQQIKQILNEDKTHKRRHSDFDDHENLKKMRASLSDNEQLSPIRF